jgi:hypothetical protein
VQRHTGCRPLTYITAEIKMFRINIRTRESTRLFVLVPS